jgi:organic radical activating enzyme
MRILLETNGLCPLPSARLKGYIDFMAVDIKLKSACGYAVGFKKYKEFLSSLSWTAGCIKAIISPSSMLKEIEAAAKLARQFRPEWDFILQPVTGKQWNSIKNQRVLELLSQKALEINPRARIIPQVHRLMGIK